MTAIPFQPSISSTKFVVGTSCSDVLFEADLLRFLWLWGAGNWFLWDRFGLQWSPWLQARVTSEDTESSQGDSMGLQYNNPKNYWLQIIPSSPSTAGFSWDRFLILFLSLLTSSHMIWEHIYCTCTNTRSCFQPFCWQQLVGPTNQEPQAVWRALEFLHEKQLCSWDNN